VLKVWSIRRDSLRGTMPGIGWSSAFEGMGVRDVSLVPGFNDLAI
jgi:hypothetical protein